MFHPNGKELIASSRQGIQRLPVRSPLATRADGSAQGLSRLRWSIEPPRKLPIAGASEGRMDLDHNGRKLVIDMPSDHAVVIDLDDPAKQVRLAGHPSHHYVAISPDGRWAATGTFQGNGVQVCNAETGHSRPSCCPTASVPRSRSVRTASGS